MLKSKNNHRSWSFLPGNAALRVRQKRPNGLSRSLAKNSSTFIYSYSPDIAPSFFRSLSNVLCGVSFNNVDNCNSGLKFVTVRQQNIYFNNCSSHLWKDKSNYYSNNFMDTKFMISSDHKHRKEFVSKFWKIYKVLQEVNWSIRSKLNRGSGNQIKCLTFI